MNILLAEDEVHIAKLIQFKLERDGFQVTAVTDGEQAIQVLNAQPWSLIILDIMMPKKDGWEVLEAARANAKTKETPILLLTAKSVQKDLENAKTRGASGYLTKPFDPNHLLATVKEYVQKK